MSGAEDSAKKEEKRELGYFAGIKNMYRLMRKNDGPDGTFNRYGGHLSYRAKMDSEQSGRRNLCTSGGRFFSVDIVRRNWLFYNDYVHCVNMRGPDDVFCRRKWDWIQNTVRLQNLATWNKWRSENRFTGVQSTVPVAKTWAEVQEALDDEGDDEEEDDDEDEEDNGDEDEE